MHCKVGVPSENANVHNRGRSLRNKQNKCAVRHKILVETIFPHFFVPLGTKLFYFSETYLTARLIEEIIVFYRYEVSNGTATLFEKTNFVGLSYYGSHYKRGAATM